MSFRDPIVGGIGTLIRAWIKSPDYVPGVSGWSINKDGTAEFQDVLVRGDLSGSTLTIPEGAGPTDPRIVIDNTGISVYQTAGTLSTRIPFGQLADLYTNVITTTHGGTVNGEAVSIVPDANLAKQIRWDFSEGTLSGVVLGAIPIGQPHDIYDFNPYTVGGVYSEEFTINSAVIPNAVLTQLASYTLVPGASSNAYASAMSAGGVWTCPVDGRYTFSAIVDYAAFVAGSRVALRVTNTATGDILGNIDLLSPSAAGLESVACTRWVTAGQTVVVSVLQSTGAAKATTSATRNVLNISRALA